MTFIDRSVSLVRQAVLAIGKKPLAKRAGVAHGVLRQVESDARFSPHTRKLRALETASRAVLRERGQKVPEDIQ
jgi:transcriptional regulator with XRE-family HTH domain